MLQVVKYYTNSDSKITHAEISFTMVNGELSGTASTIMELRAPLPLEDYSEAAVLKSIAVRVTEIDNLKKSAMIKLAIVAHTETAV